MEIYKIKITEEDRHLVSEFMGEYYPLEIDFNLLVSVVDQIESKGFDVFMYNDEDGYMFQVFKAAYSYKRKPEDIILCHNLLSTKTETRIGIYWEGVVKFIK